MDSSQVERERKYRLARGECERLFSVLRASGASETPEPMENILFDHPALGLRANRKLLRARLVGAGWSVTYKGPPSLGTKDTVRTEIELDIASGEPVRLLEALGFVRTGGYRNDRVTFRLGEVKVSLDDVDGQRFCEIEAMVPSADLDDIARRLGLPPQEIELRSYAELFGSVARSA